MSNDAIRRMYEQKLASPYRNFVPRSKDDHARILYILLFDREEKINEALRRLWEQPWFGGVRFTYDHSQSHDGYLCVKLLPSDATQEKMQAALMTRLGVKSSVSFGPDPVGYDVYVDDSERDQMVKELKKRFEPISIKGWAHVFQFRDADSE